MFANRTFQYFYYSQLASIVAFVLVSQLFALLIQKYKLHWQSEGRFSRMGTANALLWYLPLTKLCFEAINCRSINGDAYLQADTGFILFFI